MKGGDNGLKYFQITALAILAMLVTAPCAMANTVESSTMYFSANNLTQLETGEWIGFAPMLPGEYYWAANPDDSGSAHGDGVHWNDTHMQWETPDGTRADGGFDVYGRAGATAYYNSASQGVIGSDHDAYRGPGGWGSWYDPDCADYYNFTLELTTTTWALHHIGGGTQAVPTGGVPMSGTMDWTNMFATETGTGAYDPGPGSPKDPGWAADHGGGAGAWDMDWTWGSEVIPLQFPGFDVVIGPGSGLQVTLTPAPEPMSMMMLGTLGAGMFAARRMRRRKK